jgi:hypothetical protein
MNPADRKRQTRWFGVDDILRPPVKRGRFPINLTPTQVTKEREHGLIGNLGSGELARSVDDKASSPRVSPVRPNLASGSHTWTLPNTIQVKRADPWKDYLPLLYVRQGCAATLACELSEKSVDSRAFAIVKTPIGEKKSHLSKVNSMRRDSCSSFLDILDIYEWNDHLFTVAEYIPTSLREIILCQRQPDEAQVACLAHQV